MINADLPFHLGLLGRSSKIALHYIAAQSAFDGGYGANCTLAVRTTNYFTSNTYYRALTYVVKDNVSSL